jgi:hypothetical protein
MASLGYNSMSITISIDCCYAKQNIENIGNIENIENIENIANYSELGLKNVSCFSSNEFYS